jgi:hypothetical protein
MYVNIKNKIVSQKDNITVFRAYFGHLSVSIVIQQQRQSDNSLVKNAIVHGGDEYV